VSSAKTSRQALRRRQYFYDRIPEVYRDIANWPSVDPQTLPDDASKARLERLTKAAKLFLGGEDFQVVLDTAQVSEDWFFELMANALRPMRGADEICGTRAFAFRKVQKARRRVQPFLGSKKPKGGYSGLFEQLLRERPAIETALVEFLNGKERPNTVTPHLLHVKFLAICELQGVHPTSYPFNTKSKAYKPLMKWYGEVYMSRHLMSHVRKQHGPAAAVAAGWEMGDGTSQTPPMPYTVWVIDEFKVDLDSVVELPMARWDVEYVELSQFQVLRCRSIGNVQCNIAWHMCLRQQAAGPDIIRLFKNAVLGQPEVDAVEASLVYEKGAGFPQNVFPRLRYVVPILIYLDNALSHLFDPLQHLLQRLCGGRVVLGIPGRPKGRPAIESAIGHLARSLIHQLPSTTGTGPQDPVREQAVVPLGRRVQVGLLEQLLDVYLANENACESAGAGYLDAFTRLGRLADSNQIKCNYLPETKRKPHHFCEPKPVTVKVELKDGRLPYVNYQYRRYSSEWLKTQPRLREKQLYALVDYDDLRTLVLVDELGATFAIVTVEGPWSQVPHDQRMIEIYAKRKQDAQFKTRPGDAPLFAVLRHLTERAKNESQAALEYAYIMRYLKRRLPAEVLAAQAEGSDFLDVESRIVPEQRPVAGTVPAPSLAAQKQPAHAAQVRAQAQPAAPVAAPLPVGITLPPKRFQIPRRLA
jgi:putative transposase